MSGMVDGWMDGKKSTTHSSIVKMNFIDAVSLLNAIMTRIDTLHASIVTQQSNFIIQSTIKM